MSHQRHSGRENNLYQGIQSSLEAPEDAMASAAPRDSARPYNPLAGARRPRRTRRLLRLLMALLSYGLLVAAILWLTLRLWPEYGFWQFAATSDTQVKTDTTRVTTRPAQDQPEPASTVQADIRPPDATSTTEKTRPVPVDTRPRLESASSAANNTPEPQPVRQKPSTPPELDETAQPDAVPDTSLDNRARAEESAPASARSEATAEPVKAARKSPESAAAAPAPAAEPTASARPKDKAISVDKPEPEPVKTASSATADRQPGTPGATQGKPTTQPRAAEPDTTTAPSEARSASFQPSDRDQVIDRAHELFKRGEQSAALDLLETRLRHDNHTLVRQSYARLLLRAGQPQAARLVARRKADLAELELRAYAEYQVGNFSDSVELYRDLLERAPGARPEWYLWLAIGHDQLTETGAARNFYRQYLREGLSQPKELQDYARNRLNQLTP